MSKPIQTNKIYESDCLDFMMNKMLPGSVDMIFADPPYNLSGKSLKCK